MTTDSDYIETIAAIRSGDLVDLGARSSGVGE